MCLALVGAPFFFRPLRHTWGAAALTPRRPAAFDAVEPLALGDFGTLYVVAFALLSIAATLGATAFERWVAESPRGPDGPIESTAIFVISQTRDLVTLMFSALCGRYVVNLFETAKHNSGYVLFIVVSAVVLLKLWEHTANSAGQKKHD